MTTNKLLKKLKDFLGAERQAQVAKYDSIKLVLKKLKKKQNMLKDMLKKEHDAAVRKGLKKEMDVLSAQRKKGMKILKELKQARKK